MERPSTRDGSSTPTPTLPTTPSPTKRASSGPSETMAPFDPVSSDRLNTPQQQQQPGSEKRHSIHTLASPTRSSHSRDSSVSDKINQFNTLASQNKSLERKTADAALKRAMLGREEAEAEMRKYRDEARALKRQVEDGRDRERRVGERLETVMEQYGRAKETHAHTQALWEKEIRRTRKETFKSQSTIVKLQEELKSARTSLKSAQETLEREKERSLNREQEAFQARYNLVGLQEQLDKNRSELEQALEKIKTVEQERDAFKTLAKTEEDVTRIASEGRLPLPSGDEDDEFDSPKKTNSSRAVSLSLVDVRSSAASEAEIDELTRLWQWEKQRADRAADQVEYLEAECRLRACSCMKKRPRSSMVGMLSPKRQKREIAPLADPSDRMILSEKATIPPPHEVNAHAVPQSVKKTNKIRPKEREERRATIFLPDLGTFRTVSMEEAEALERSKEDEKDEGGDSQMKDAPAPAPAPAPVFVGVPEVPERYSRTPSVEPPSFALLGQERASLVSLLNAPHPQAQEHMGANTPTFPTTPCPTAMPAERTAASNNAQPAVYQQQPPSRIPLSRQDPNIELVQQENNSLKTSFNSRPHTATSFYTMTTTVPLREETAEPSMAKKLLALQKTPTRSHTAPELEMPTWDVNNPALTPTMTREQALAKIRERRGRAKSGNSGTVTPYKGMMKGRGDRRDMSAPVGRKGRMG
ncbi:hypothetical protein VM1G_02854 [Cytospora mali]|uniref:Uncharacterized protein n=1 Tax=Cytospora mali TaxID=578113 RepID=A0A194VU54_CYTMA|nr:hypothetical protein VM1G_02854 [Valsa mali]